MDHRVSKDMISSGMTPSGEKTQADLGKTQYGSAPSPNRLMDAYHSMYQNQKEETLDEMLGKGGGSITPRPAKRRKQTKSLDQVKADNETRKQKERERSARAREEDKEVEYFIGSMMDRGEKLRDAKTSPEAQKFERDKFREGQRRFKGNYGENVDLLAAYYAVYEHHQKDENGNTIPHDDDVKEGKIPAGLQAYLDKKKGKKKDDDDNGDEKKGKKGKKSKGGKPDFLDLDKDGDKKEPMKKASKEMKEGYGAAAKVALKAAKPVAKKVGKFLKNNAGNITNAGLTGLTVASFLPRPQPKDTKEEKEQVNEFLGTAVGGTVGTALGGPVGGLVGGAAGAVTGAIAKKATGMVKNKIKKPIVSSNIGQNKNISADVDLFDLIKGTLLDEGLSEKEVREIMISLTPEEINEVIQLDEITGSLLMRASKAADKARGVAAAAGDKALAAKKAAQSSKFYKAGAKKNIASTDYSKPLNPQRTDYPMGKGASYQQK